MANFQPITKASHAERRWRRYSRYDFAAGDAVAPLVMHELPRAALALPIAFIAGQDGFIPVSVQGLAPGRNLFVAPDGRWLAAYVPATYRGYPFALMQAAEDQQVLCFDADSGLLSDTDGERFFDEDGNPAQPVRDVLDFLSQVRANREATHSVCATLHRHGLIQPWPIKTRGASGEQVVEGLYRVDETVLNTLPLEALDEVRRVGGLPVLYCQLLSMQNMALLGRLAQAHAQAAAAPVQANGELDLEFLNKEGTIQFGNLGAA